MQRVKNNSDKADILDDFLFTIAHDLKAPLSLIRSVSLDLGDSLGTATIAEVKEGFTDIAQSGDDALSLVQDLLTVYGLKNSTAQTELFPVSVTQEINKVSSELENMMQLHGRKVKFKIRPRGAMVLANQWLLRRSVSNLLQNSIKYSKGKKPVLIEVMQTGKSLELSFIDNGPIVSQADIDAMDGTLNRTTSKRNAGVSGLGLYLTGKMVAAMQGTISYKTADDINRFTITLPIVHQLSLF